MQGICAQSVRPRETMRGIGAAHAATAGTRPQTILTSFWWYATKLISRRPRDALGLLAHVDAGKTTLAEALLYDAGRTRRLGRVDHGSSALDTNGWAQARHHDSLPPRPSSSTRAAASRLSTHGPRRLLGRGGARAFGRGLRRAGGGRKRRRAGPHRDHSGASLRGAHPHLCLCQQDGPAARR